MEGPAQLGVTSVDALHGDKQPRPGLDSGLAGIEEVKSNLLTCQDKLKASGRSAGPLRIRGRPAMASMMRPAPGLADIASRWGPRHHIASKRLMWWIMTTRPDARYRKRSPLLSPPHSPILRQNIVGWALGIKALFLVLHRGAMPTMWMRVFC